MGSKKKASKVTTLKSKSSVTKSSGRKKVIYRMSGSSGSAEYLYADLLEAKGNVHRVKNVMRGICSLTQRQVPVQNQQGGVEVGSRVEQAWAYFMDDYLTDYVVNVELSNVLCWREMIEGEEIYSQHDNAINQRRQRQVEEEAERIKQEKLKELQLKKSEGKGLEQ